MNATPPVSLVSHSVDSAVGGHGERRGSTSSEVSVAVVEVELNGTGSVDDGDEVGCAVNVVS